VEVAKRSRDGRSEAACAPAPAIRFSMTARINPTHAVQQKDILTVLVERDVSLLDNGLPFFHFGCEQSG
jgi:hypothetical protein